MGSNAVSLELISKVTGYLISKGNFNTVTQNLPQSIAIIGEVNEAFQGSVTFDEGYEILSAQEAGETFGFGSPIHMAMRILRPVSGSGVSGIPTIVYPQEKAAGATENILEIVATGVATANVTHTLVVAGRTGLDGVSYDFTVNTGDTAAEIHAKIEDALNNVLGCPFSAVSTDYECTATSKWAGLTADDLDITVQTNSNAAGITYAVAQTQAGAGTPSVATSLAAFGSTWHTVVLNTYGTVTSVMDALESTNGIPDPSTPTGRYSTTTMKPFFAFTGSVADDPSSITDTRLDDVTIAICPAPLSDGHPLEAAANCALLYCPQAQNEPHTDISGKYFPDMPTPTSIGSMDTYLNRDAIVKKGCSTVELSSGKYRMMDFVTTYHKVGENPPQFRYVRSLTQDLNIFYQYYLLEQIHVVDKALANDTDTISVSNVIKPKQWKQILFQLADQLAAKSLIADTQFMKDSIAVNIGASNPDRFETSFQYKRSGFARVASTTAQAGFNFSN